MPKRKAPSPASQHEPRNRGSVDKLRTAIAAHQRGQLDEAEKTYQAILKIRPSDPNALHFLGVLLHQRGRSQEAIARIQRALKIDPDYLDARLNLGNIYKENGELAKAATMFRKIIALKPDHIGAYNNLGVVLNKSGDYQEAAHLLEQALTLDSNNAECLLNLGNSYRNLEQIEQAIDAYTRSIALMPKQQEAYKSLCYLLWRNNRIAEASDVLNQWLETKPDDPLAKHYAHAIQGTDIPDRASDAYVQQTFDAFAATFDASLKELDYKAPELIAEALAAIYPNPNKQLSVLDAGCGTGLCASWLRPYARTLVGVDLSAAMLEKARGRKLYDDLIQAELVDYIDRHQATFDLIVSADTLCYFGELQPFFQAVRQALRPDGCLVFTLEQYQGDDKRNFTLNPHGRYSHRAEYVQQTIAANGLRVRALCTVTLRMESGQAVNGLLVTASVT